MTPHPVADITRAYEALRAQAIGEATGSGPRGLALILDQGVAAWIRAWSWTARTAVATIASPPASASDPAHAELASVLAEMALATRRGAA